MKHLEPESGGGWPGLGAGGRGRWRLTGTALLLRALGRFGVEMVTTLVRPSGSRNAPGPHPKRDRNGNICCAYVTMT